MSVEEIHVPDLGGADEVEVIEVNVSIGDTVAEEDPIITVESDKASVELPAPAAGRIKEIKVAVGDSLSEGDLVALLDTEDAGDESEPDEAAAEEPGSGASDSDEDSKGEASASGGQGRQEIVTVPDIGGSEDVPVIEVQVKPGDEIAEDDPVVTLESDKATMEIPSPYAGRVDEVLVKVDDTVSQGDELLRMTVCDTGEGAGGEAETEKEAAKQPASESGSGGRPSSAQGSGAPAPQAGREKTAPPSPKTAPAEGERQSARVHAGPAVRKLAREFGVELGNVKGSGPKSRILKEDVQQYVQNQLRERQSPAAGGGALPGVKLPDFSQFGQIERRPLSRLQAMTAENMHRSWLNVPHVTQFDEADISELEQFRKAQKAEGERRGVKMTPLAFLLKACAHALARYPQFNVSLDLERGEMIQKQYIHIGIAVDTPAGLMVPVIRDVDHKGLWELAGEAQDLAARARERKLSPNEMQGACFSITSLGGIGGTAFTPIINTPEVAILGVSKSQTRPVWDGESFQPRLMLPLSLSYDHRAVNGADAARFTSLLSSVLGDLRQLLL